MAIKRPRAKAETEKQRKAGRAAKERRNEKAANAKEFRRELFPQLDATAMIVPLLVVVGLCVLFLLLPEASTRAVDGIRGFLGDQLSSFYILVGEGSLIVSLYIAFSKYGNIRLGGADEKPAYSDFQWGAMIFTGTMAADILYDSFCEWALYAQESRIAELGGMQDWASTYPLFHWGPVPWSFYMVLSACFGFMIHVRRRTKQKFSEGCRLCGGGPFGTGNGAAAVFFHAQRPGQRRKRRRQNRGDAGFCEPVSRMVRGEIRASDHR